MKNNSLQTYTNYFKIFKLKGTEKLHYKQKYRKKFLVKSSSQFYHCPVLRRTETQFK